MASTVSSFSVGISADVSEMVSGFNQAAMASQQLVSGMNSVGQSMGAVGGGQATSGIGELGRVMELLALRTEDTSRQISRLAQGNERLIGKINAARQATRGQTETIREQRTEVDQLASAKQRLFDSISDTAALDTAFIDESSEMATLERLQIKMRQMKDQQRGESILGDLKKAEADIERIKGRQGSSADAAIGGTSSDKKMQDQLNEALNRRAVAMRQLEQLQNKQNAGANKMAVLQQRIGDEEYRIGQLREKRKNDDDLRKAKERERVAAKIKDQTKERIELEERINAFMNPRKAQQDKMQRERQEHMKKVKKLLEDQVRAGKISQSYGNHLLRMESKRIKKAQELAVAQKQALKAQRNMGYAAQQFGFLLDDLVAGSGTRGVAGAIQASANNVTSMLATMRASAKVVFGASIMIALLQISAQTGLLNKALEKLGMTAGDAVKELKEVGKMHEHVAKTQKDQVRHLREMQNLRLNIDIDSAASSLAGINDQLANAVIDAQKKGAQVRKEQLINEMSLDSGDLLSYTKAFLSAGNEIDSALSDKLARNRIEMMSNFLTGGLLAGEEQRNHLTKVRGALLKQERDRRAEIAALEDNRTDAQKAQDEAHAKVNRLLEKQQTVLQQVIHHNRDLAGVVADRVDKKKHEIQEQDKLLAAGRDEISTAQKRKKVDQERSRLMFDMQQGEREITRQLKTRDMVQRRIDDLQAKMNDRNASLSRDEKLKKEQQLGFLYERQAETQKNILKSVEDFEKLTESRINNQKALLELQKLSNQNAESSRSTIFGMMGGINEKFAEELRKTERRAQFEREIKELREAQFVDQDKIDQRMKNFDRVERMETRRNALLEKQKKLREELNALSNVSVQDAVDARSTEAGKLMNQSIIDAMTTKQKDPQVEELKKVNEQLRELEQSVKEIPTVNLQTS